MSQAKSCFCDKLKNWRIRSTVDVLVCPEITASLKRRMVSASFAWLRAKRSPFTFSMKSIPVTISL